VEREYTIKKPGIYPALEPLLGARLDTKLIFRSKHRAGHSNILTCPSFVLHHDFSRTNVKKLHTSMKLFAAV
jgi:hypothetical protein